jgi:ABC-type antimicrobial peptide transport system permease subunit
MSHLEPAKYQHERHIAQTVVARNPFVRKDLFPKWMAFGTLFLYPLWLVVGVPLLVCLITTMAAWYPAVRAARVDPVTSLRHE